MVVVWLRGWYRLTLSVCFACYGYPRGLPRCPLLCRDVSGVHTISHTTILRSTRRHAAYGRCVKPLTKQCILIESCRILQHMFVAFTFVQHSILVGTFYISLRRNPGLPEWRLKGIHSANAPAAKKVYLKKRVLNLQQMNLGSKSFNVQ